MNDAQVLVEVEAGVAWLTLNRPRELNALSRQMLDELNDAIGLIEADEGIRCVVLTGAGRAFCAGADLKFIAAMEPETRDKATLEFLAHVGATVSRLERLPKPVIAAVNGVAVAGGMELLLGCDLVVAAESARLGDGHAKYGLVPAAGASVRLPRRIGANRANYLFFTGELVPAAALLSAGLINEVVPDEALRSAATALAAKIVAKSPIFLRLMKELAASAQEGTQEDALRRELEFNETYTASYDRNEGLAAFLEGRTPVFTGR